VVAGAVGEAQGFALAGGLEEVLGGEIGGDRGSELRRDGGGLGGLGRSEGAAVEGCFVEDEEEAPFGVARRGEAGGVVGLLGEKRAYRPQRGRVVLGGARGGGVDAWQASGGHARRDSSVAARYDDYSVRKAQVTAKRSVAAARSWVAPASAPPRLRAPRVRRLEPGFNLIAARGPVRRIGSAAALPA
jgi:hypothetical protein